jgi:hypothetical protein
MQGVRLLDTGSVAIHEPNEVNQILDLIKVRLTKQHPGTKRGIRIQSVDEQRLTPRIKPQSKSRPNLLASSQRERSHATGMVVKRPPILADERTLNGPVQGDAPHRKLLELPSAAVLEDDPLKLEVRHNFLH